jgi:hypothetical protein
MTSIARRVSGSALRNRTAHALQAAVFGEFLQAVSHDLDQNPAAPELQALQTGPP